MAFYNFVLMKLMHTWKTPPLPYKYALISTRIKRMRVRARDKEMEEWCFSTHRTFLYPICDDLFVSLCDLFVHVQHGWFISYSLFVFSFSAPLESLGSISRQCNMCVCIARIFQRPQFNSISTQYPFPSSVKCVFVFIYSSFHFVFCRLFCTFFSFLFPLACWLSFSAKSKRYGNVSANK